MDLEAVRNIVKGLVNVGNETEAEKSYKMLFRGSMGLAVRPKVSLAHQKGARSWGKTLMKFKKKNIFVSPPSLCSELLPWPKAREMSAVSRRKEYGLRGTVLLLTQACSVSHVVPPENYATWWCGALLTRIFPLTLNAVGCRRWLLNESTKR